MRPYPPQCHQCGETLRGRVVWLEMNARTTTYHANEGEVSPEESQGCFPFGAACARTVLANGGRRK